MSREALEVRRMREADLDAVAVIEQALFSKPWSRESLAGAMKMPGNLYLSAFWNGQLAGYCGMWRSFEEGNITNVAVAEPFRRRGIAAGMLSRLMEMAAKEGVSRFFLEVRAGNEPALRLYEGLGFSRIGIRKNFYECPAEDAVIMEKNIAAVQTC